MGLTDLECSRISNASYTFLYLLLPQKPLPIILKSFSETC